MSNDTAVTDICQRLRANAESSRWSYKGGYTDWAMYLSMLDIAQLFGNLNLFWDARSASYAAGVSPTAASHSLMRLSNAHRIIPYPQNEIAVEHRIPKNTANAYLISPVFPNVYSYVLPNETYPLPTRGNTALAPLDAGENVNVSTGEIQDNLIGILRDTTHTYTQSVSRLALLIGRTELGVMLGKPAVRLCLYADETPRTIKELASLAQVNPVTAGQVIRRKLSPKGLLTNVGGEWFALDSHPGGGWWERGRWVLGTPLHRYEIHPSNKRVDRRLSRIAKDRRDRHAEIIRAQDRWIAAELRKEFLYE